MYKIKEYKSENNNTPKSQNLSERLIFAYKLKDTQFAVSILPINTNK